MRAPLAFLAVLALAAVVVAGCDSDPGAKSARPVSVVATTTQLGDFVREVGGDRVGVTQVLAPNSDPHGFEPRPSDARAVEEGDVVFRSGGDVDDWMKELISANGGAGKTHDLIDSVHKRTGEGGETDPHWWQDPRNAERAVVAIRKVLVARDPDGKAGYDRNARRYIARLHVLDRSIAACVGRIPAERRTMVTSHDALGYYAARYGIRLVGAVIPSLSTQAQPSSKQVDALVGQIRRERVAAIFPESSLNPKLERAVARESGAKVGQALWADSLGPKGSSGATYVGSLESNTHRIVDGISGGSVRCTPRA